MPNSESSQEHDFTVRSVINANFNLLSPNSDSHERNARPYTFLTGGTGLLGGYVIRDLLRHGVKLAVLVRPSRKATAEKRINNILSHFDRENGGRETGEKLSRPVVIEGDLTDSAWRAKSQNWIAENCQSVIHCAASLTFYGSRDADPWTTNILGTQQVLDLCKESNIRHLHHFSTAYVAGDYRGEFTEEMFDVGQTLCNDYEKSKFEAERMVREADFLDSLTIYRPSIVVGDSQTFYTSAYNGYYAILKLAHTLVNRLMLGETSGRRLLSALGMNGSERKNFVPVDWVIAVFTHIFTHQELHGKTYHLTNSSPTPITEMVDTIQDAVETYSKLAQQNDAQHTSEDWFQQNYAEQGAIFQGYFNDDPAFVSQNTPTVAPHLPCPRVDHAALLAMSHFAITHNFGKRVPKLRAIH